MQSLFKVIKCGRVVKQGDAVIDTKFSCKGYENVNDDINDNNVEKLNDDAQDAASYAELAVDVVENAKKEAEMIKSKAMMEAEQIEQNAYEKGYNTGQDQGYKDGYDEGYNSAIEKVNAEAKGIIGNANSVLNQAKQEYCRYLEEKNDEIKNIIIDISQKILKKEVENTDALNSMLFEALQSIRGVTSITIKCNKLYYSEIKDRVEEWKESMVLNLELFVIEDNSIEDGKALLEKDNGKIIVDINYGLEKIKEVLMEN
jgi:flagellar assembly protein FliH